MTLNGVRIWGALCLLLAMVGSQFAMADVVKIGVLSHRGYAATLRMWSPTAEYLTQVLPQHTFRIVPLEFQAVNPHVADNLIDFVLVNPGIYVNLEVQFGVARITTLNNRRKDTPFNIFGGVIFTRADRQDIQTLDDLRGRRFMAVDATSLGGFQMAWRQLKQHDIDPYKDFSHLSFAGIHDRVVMAVLNGEVDAGTVRTDILERMEAVGEISSADFRILNPQTDPAFPFALSTRLYPEWPFAKTHKTSNALAQQVAVALLRMPHNHAAALAGSYAGWTVPLDYQPVHELFKDLKLPPYEALGRFTLGDVIKRYWYWFILAMVVVIFMGTMISWVMRLNTRLQKAKMGLERQHNLILSSVGDGIMGVDTEGNTTFFNPAMERLTGWSAEDLVGKNQHDLMHHTRADGSPYPRQECPVYATFRDNKPHLIDDDVFWRKDGTSFPVEYLSTPVRDDQGQTVGSVVVVRDVTERKKAEEEARQHHAELAHVTRLSTMGEMATGIAHELNQPLSAINNFASGCIRKLRSDNWQPQELLEVMDMISTQAQRAGEIIRQLRRFIRKDQPGFEWVNLNQRIEKLEPLLRPEARKAAVSIELSLSEHVASIQANGIQIEQVVVNLARNAIDAMVEHDSPKRRLRISTARAGQGETLIRVVDSGPGIPADQLEQIFAPFYTTKTSGTGLGLSISRAIIEAHGGHMEVSSVSRGTTITCYLPNQQ